MKKNSLFLFFIMIMIDSYSQNKQDTANKCCEKNVEASESEAGTPASFPGGEFGFRKWLGKSVDIKRKKLGEINLQGKCLFTFNIDTSGRLLNLQFCSRQGTTEESVIRDIFDKCPLWKPAISYKRGKVAQSFCQSIDFGFIEE
jgi:hypothetical protein